MARIRAPPRIVRSVSLSYEFDKLCMEHRISVSEAARVGISILLAEKGIGEYDNNLTIMRRIRQLQQKLEEVSQKYFDLLDKQEKKK